MNTNYYISRTYERPRQERLQLACIYDWIVEYNIIVTFRVLSYANKTNLCSGNSRGRQHRVHVHANKGGRRRGAEQDAVGARSTSLTPAARAAARAPPPPATQVRHLLLPL